MKNTLQKNRDTCTLVRQFTGLSEEEHNSFFFNLGSEWCDRHTVDSTNANALAADPAFWAWWGQVWREAEQGFIDQVSFNIDLGTWSISRSHPITREPMVLSGAKLRLFYLKLQEAIMKDCRTNTVVLNKAYRLKPVFNPLNEY